MDAPEPYVANLMEEKLTIKQLNKLGRNQFSKKIEAIINNHETIDRINSRYVYVTEYDDSRNLADIYCLAKGVYESVKIDSKAFKKNPIEKGQLVYCTKFKKLEGGDLGLVEYTITDKIEEQSERLL